MSDARPHQPFFLVVADYDHGVFAVEGPMTDDKPWQAAARRAQSRQRHIECGPAGSDREALAQEFQRTNKLGGVPPGSIIRPG